MPLTTISNQLVALTLRSCSRCGQEFAGLPGAYVCDTCRKPKIANPDHFGKPLTPRERHVATLVSRALSNKEIAWELHLSEGTVKEYLSVMFKKLGVQNRTQLALWMIANEQNAA